MESSTVSGSRPREKARHACASRSTTSTRRPSSTSAAASDATVVVLATPPFWLATAMVRASVTGITVAAACEAARVKDEGLFGPESLTWQVHADPILWIAGLRALLLQAVHPAAMAGVLQHSDFRADPWGRLRRTADYVGVVTFGSTAEVETIGRRVRALHATVRGHDEATGVSYRASDPTLLYWVHCCE